MSKYTAGPWEWQSDSWLTSMSGLKDDILEAEDSGASGYESFGSPRIGHHYDEDQKKANKALISAAPELLEALENLLHYIETDDMRELNMNSARAAIKKAKGETE